VSERRACRALGQHRSVQRYAARPREDEDALTATIVRLASQFGRYGYRRITALLRNAGWDVNHKRVERIWRREGLRVPQKQPKRGRLWLMDGSCIRLRPQHPNHVWAYDFVADRTGEVATSWQGRVAMANERMRGGPSRRRAGGGVLSVVRRLWTTCRVGPPDPLLRMRHHQTRTQPKSQGSDSGRLE